MNEITSPGFHSAITAREYFAEPCPQPALTASGIKTLLGKTAAEFAYSHPAITPDSPEAASSAAKRFGDVSHQLALGKGRGYAIGDFPTWASNAAKEFKAAAEEAGQTPVKRHEFETAEACAKIMRADIEDTLKLFGPASAKAPKFDTEVVIAWQEETAHGPIWCRAMLDVWCDAHGVILDPKFSKRLGDGVFETHASGLGWDLQAAWYLRGISHLRPDLAGRARFINLLVSPDAPHVSRVREADEATLYSCLLEIERAITRFAACLKAGNWPGYPRVIEPWTAKSWTMAERAARAALEETDG